MFNLEQYLNDHSLDFKETETDYQLRECPSCGDRRWKFGISKEEGHLANCFICESSYNIYSFVALVDNISISKARKIIHKSRDLETKAKLEKNVFKPKTGLKVQIQPIELLPEFKKLYKHIEYTKKRGLSIKLIKKYNLHVCRKGKWKNRLIIPVIKDGLVYGWQGRDVTGKAEKKIISCKGFRKSRFVLNYDNIKNRKSAILCEGPFDCMHADSFGAFAIFGKELSNSQINLLLSTKLKRIFIGLDPDYEVSRKKAAKNLSQFFDVWIMPIPDGKDLGEMKKNEIDQALRKSKKFNDFNKL